MSIPSEATQRAYERRFLVLQARFEKETEGQVGSAPSLVRFVKWLQAYRPTLTPATWRQYRAAVNFKIRSVAMPQQMPRIEEVLAPLNVIDTDEAREARKTLSARTSAKKLKKFIVEDQKKIFDRLASEPTRNSEPLRLCLASGLLTGLRPAEWQDAKIVRDTPLTLRVRNAKCDEIRGNGEFRVLRFGKIGAAARADLYAWLDVVAQAGEDYPGLQGRLADFMHSLTRSIWPRRTKNVTMYSTRHEFAAVAKLALHGNDNASAILAALMGHASDVTASTHYARFGKGKEVTTYLAQAMAMLPSPQDNEVNSVRRKLEKKIEFLESNRESEISAK